MNAKTFSMLPSIVMISLTVLSIVLVGAGFAVAGRWSWALVSMGSMLFAAQAIDQISGAMRR